MELGQKNQPLPFPIQKSKCLGLLWSWPEELLVARLYPEKLNAPMLCTVFCGAGPAEPAAASLYPEK